MRGIRAATEDVYGREGAFSLPLLTWARRIDEVSDTDTTQKIAQSKKSTINHHLSRFYPQIKGPHKRD